jgi:hypothetical protein
MAAAILLGCGDGALTGRAKNGGGEGGEGGKGCDGVNDGEGVSGGNDAEGGKGVDAGAGSGCFATTGGGGMAGAVTSMDTPQDLQNLALVWFGALHCGQFCWGTACGAGTKAGAGGSADVGVGAKAAGCAATRRSHPHALQNLAASWLCAAHFGQVIAMLRLPLLLLAVPQSVYCNFRNYLRIHRAHCCSQRAQHPVILILLILEDF